MTDRFLDPAYLARGNDRQRAAHRALADLRIFETLAPFRPLLSGTIPLAIDVAGSDLDVLCEVHDFDAFAEALGTAYGHAPDYTMSTVKPGRDGPYRTASFGHGGFVIEVFGQAIAVTRQGAYRHMVIQARLLDLGGDGLRREIVALRREGLKTEPAFARRLGVAGDPYIALLGLEEADDEALQVLLDDAADPHGG